MLEEILGDCPQIRVIDYLLMNPFCELTRQEIAVGSGISTMSLNKFFDNLIYNELIVKKDNSKYCVNLKSPLIGRINQLLDEINKIDYERQMQYPLNEKEEYSDEELEEIFNAELYERDINELEREIIDKEHQNLL